MSGAVEGVALLPCPFCGGEASLTIPSELVIADCADIYVACDECEAEGQHIVVEMRDRGDDLWPDERREAIAAWNTRTTPPARSYADEDVALDAAISAMSWTDKRMVEDARKIAAGFWFETYGFGGDCCLTGSQATSFRSCLDGARAAIRLLSQEGKA